MTCKREHTCLQCSHDCFWILTPNFFFVWYAWIDLNWDPKWINHSRRKKYYNTMVGLLSLQHLKFPAPLAQTNVLHKRLTVDQTWKEDRKGKKNDRKEACQSSLMTRTIITQVREVLREGSLSGTGSVSHLTVKKHWNFFLSLWIASIRVFCAHPPPDWGVDFYNTNKGDSDGLEKPFH